MCHCSVTLSLLLPVANPQLRGTTVRDAALVQQYVNFADNEILPACCTWTFPTLGIMQYNKQVSRHSVFAGCKINVHDIGHRTSSDYSQESIGCSKWSACHKNLSSGREGHAS